MVKPTELSVIVVVRAVALTIMVTAPGAVHCSKLPTPASRIGVRNKS